MALRTPHSPLRTRISLRDSGLAVGDRVLPWLAAVCHYWRLDPARWPLILDRVRALGFELVQTYVPWSVHERAPGAFDFGADDPRCDLPRFLDLLHERGLFALLRPGPHINAELTYFGYPKRLFAREELWARGANGNPVVVPAPPRAFPALSYAAPAWYEEIARWFDALAPLLVERRAPDGPLVGLQTDNEMALFFRTAIYDQDYSDAAVTAYRAFLRARSEGDLDRLADAYGRRYAAWEAVDPPRAFTARCAAELPWHLDWVAFHEHLMRDALARLRAMWEDRGVAGLLWFHNYPYARYSVAPYDVAGAETVVDVQGADLYPLRRDMGFVRRVCSHLQGTSRLPALPELCCGSTMIMKPLLPDDLRTTTSTALMHGVRALSFYMLVERDRWYGSAIDRHGEYRAETADYYRALLADLRALGFPRWEKQADLLLAANREYGALEAATYLFAPVPPMALDERQLRADLLCREDDFGWPTAPQMAHQRVIDAWDRLLAAGDYAFDHGDTGAPDAHWRRYRAVLVPTFTPMSRDLQARLAAFVRAGGTLLIGPELPRADWAGRPETLLAEALAGADVRAEAGARCYRLGAGALWWIDQMPPDWPDRATAAVEGGPWRAALAAAGLEPLLPTGDPELEATWHRTPTGDLLFLANPTAEPRRAHLALPAGAHLAGVTARTPVAAEVDLAPWSVQWFRLEGVNAP